MSSSTVKTSSESTTSRFTLSTVTTAFVAAVATVATAHLALTLYRRKTRLQRAYQLIDEVNATDPRTPPQELEYGQRMSVTLAKYDADASDVVKVACRGQHIARWRIPRSDFPEGKAGYLKWRKTLYAMHAEIMRGLLEKAGGFSQGEIDKVALLVGKQWDLKNDKDANAVEDVAALVFLEYYFPAFTDKLNEADKMVDIVRKTWVKMSPKGKEEAVKLSLPPSQAEIVKRALTPASSTTEASNEEA